MPPQSIRLLSGAAFAGLVLPAGQLFGQAGSVVTTTPPPPPIITAPLPPGAPVDPSAVQPVALPYRVVNDARWNDTPIDFTPASTTARPARLVNLSVRAAAGTVSNPLIVGAGIRGQGDLPVLVRAIGPGLSRFGVTDALRTSPDLTVFSGSSIAAKTNLVASAAIAAATHVGAFPALTGTEPGDAALVGRPAAGTLTVHCTSVSGDAGAVLLEFYDANPGSAPNSPQLVNLSSRGVLDGSGAPMVLGFVVAGDGERAVLLRGVGPSLQPFGVSGALGDPRIELYSGGTLIASNDNWLGSGSNELDAAAKSVGAFPLTSDRDAALLVNLQAGAYTLHVRGAAATAAAGTVLAEVYDVGMATSFDAAQATNVVGLDVYRQLAASTPAGNLILSPYSIESAFALAYVGAAGDTRTEMSRVLRMPADNAAVQSGFARLRDALTALATESVATAQARNRAGAHFDPIEWNAANRVFGQEDFAFRDSFLALMRDGFAAPLQPLDFAHHSEAARLLINTWISEQTRNRINDLIPPGGVSSATRFALVNALYLKAPWDTPFEKSRTTTKPFHLPGGTTRDVSTMLRTDYLGYANESGLTVVTLPYLGRELQFVILLPAGNDTVAAVASRLTAGDFARWATLPTGSTYVSLSLPKFTVPGATAPLGAALRALGMTTAFDVPAGSANFDGIAPRTPLDYVALSEVFHQTFVAVDEQGTEAAAATAVIGGTTSVPVTPVPIEVRVDRPFLFAIQHRASGTCLFIGRIDDPK